MCGAIRPASLMLGMVLFTHPASPAQPAEAGTVLVKDATPAPAPEAVRETKADKIEPAPAAEEFSWSNSASGTLRLNPTGGDIEMQAPLRLRQFFLGDVVVRISPKQEVCVLRERFQMILKEMLRPEALAALNAVPASRGCVPLDGLASHGFNVRFDVNQLAMRLDLTVEQRAVGQIKGASIRRQAAAANVSQPAHVSGYVNLYAGADYVSGQGIENRHINFQAAMRWADVVFEGQGNIQGDHFSRRATRLVYDAPEQAIRVSAGDIAPPVAGFQNGSDLLGVTAEKSYGKLQPGAAIHATSNRSFRLEEAATVDVKINGVPVQHLRLQPGDYNLDDLPLTTGANDITLSIQDESGNVRTLNYTVFSDRSLMAPDIAEWGISGGVATRAISKDMSGARNLWGTVDYGWTSPVVTGFYRQGLTEDLTGEVHFQADAAGAMGGAAAFFQTPFGFFDVEGAVSDFVHAGAGTAADLTYTLANAEGSDGVRRSFRLAAGYRSEKFAPVSVAAPRNDVKVNLAASYSQQLPWNISGSISGNYGLRRDGGGDQYGGDICLSRNFGPEIGVGLTAGYQVTSQPVLTETGNIRAGIRLAYRVDERTGIESGYDSRDGRSHVSYRTQGESGTGNWSTQVTLEREPDAGGEETYNVTGATGFSGNRGEFVISRNSPVGPGGHDAERRTSVSTGTAIAFADGMVAVGRPVADGFAIVTTHSSLADNELAVGTSQEQARAAADALGPALVSDVPAYTPSRLPIDIADLPPGYDLGTGGFDVNAPYKGGYKLIAGSEYAVTAYGTLIGDDGKPVALLTGDAYQPGHPEGRHVPVFTNSAGRFGAPGLRPGKWVLDMATEPKTQFVIEVPSDATGLLQLDTLRPAKHA